MLRNHLATLLFLSPILAPLVQAVHAARGGVAPVFGPGELLRADGLSALLMACVAAVASLVLFLSPGYGRETQYTPSQMRRYQFFINLFIFSMLLAVSANNVGVMWIAIEATTIFSALLIPLTLTKASVEASWKYILICSVGIALAFAGTVLGYFDFVSLSGRVENALNWPVLLSHAPSLHPEVMKLAFVFLLVGYGIEALGLLKLQFLLDELLDRLVAAAGDGARSRFPAQLLDHLLLQVLDELCLQGLGLLAGRDIVLLQEGLEAIVGLRVLGKLLPARFGLGPEILATAA